MLGFDAIGRLALGQSSRPTSNYILTASVGAFVITGIAAVFNTSMTSSAGSFVITGYDSIPNILYPSSGGSFTITGIAATLTLNQLWTEKTREDEVWTEKVYGA